MKKRFIVFIVFVFVLGYFWGAEKTEAAGPTYIDSSIFEPSVWTKENSPYVINSAMVVEAQLTIEPGTIIKFNRRARLHLGRDISIKGTEKDNIIFTSINDDSVGGDTNGDGGATVPMPGDGVGVFIYDGVNVEIEYAQFSYLGVGLHIARYTGTMNYSPKEVSIKKNIIRNNIFGIQNWNAKPRIEWNVIQNNETGILSDSKSVDEIPKFEYNIISDNDMGVRGYYYIYGFDTIRLDMRNNWWGDARGPYYRDSIYENDTNESKRDSVSHGVLFDPWLQEEPTLEEAECQENCFSNVLFLPGIKSSKLYKQGELGTEDQLWPPNFFGNDIEELGLNQEGESIEAIYTRDLVEEVGAPVIGGNIYKSFLQKLADLKNEQSINDFDVFAYDWRQDVEDIVENGTAYQNEIRSVIATLDSLAKNSKSHKVTIVAHSNGGLLAKAVMLELERLGLENEVDKIILVGTPQMGTPLATLSMLYGYDESALFGTLISRKDARELAENMPGAYGLLPSREYFNRTQEPLIKFDSQNTSYADFIDAYGSKISNIEEFKNFLLGTLDGREKPVKSEVEKENILNENLLSQAIEMHDRLDSWVPPQGVEVVQIAGWGLDTVSGVEYTEKEKVSCVIKYGNLVCLPNGEYDPIYEPKFTVDGDKVVVSPSALMFPEALNIKRYWVDLWSQNKGLNINREHKDLFEIVSVQQTILNIIKESNETGVLPENIFTYRPNPEGYKNQSSKIRMSLYSPLDIHLYDKNGNHTGPKKIIIDGEEKVIFEENIPNSYYYEFGERKYVGFSGKEEIEVEMDGYAQGSYSLKIEEVQVSEDKEEVVETAKFSNLPTVDGAVVSFVIPEDGLVGMTPLEADMDQDGEVDYQIEKNLDGEAVLLTSLDQILQSVDEYEKQGLIVGKNTTNLLRAKLREIVHVEEMIDKMKNKEKEEPEENQKRLYNKKVEDLIDLIERKMKEDISDSVREIMTRSLEYIKI